MTEALAAQAPWWQPGERHGYHVNTQGFLLGEVIRRISGKTLGTYLRDEIAGPAGIDFFIGFGPELDARCADLIPPRPGADMEEGRGVFEGDPATLAGLEASIVTLRRLTGGEPVEHEGRTWQVSRSTRRVPIYLAAEGPRTLELAGGLADGVIVGLGLTPDVIALSLAAIERGAHAAGRALADVDVWWLAKTSLADRRDEAIEPIKMALAASANHAFRFTLEGKGVPPDLHEKIKALQREYNAHHHEVPGAANAALPDRWDLTDFLADRFAIAGTPDDCVAQISRAMAAGARQFMITGFVPDPRAFMRRWAREVVAALR